MSSTKQTIYILAAAALVLMFVFLGLYVTNSNEMFLILGIISMTTCYHIVIRLIIEMICEAAFRDGVDYDNSGWFEESESEQRFYEIIELRRWKGKLPKLESTDFSLKKQGIENIIIATCQIEVIHEANMIASFFSLFLGVMFGYMWIYLTVAIAAALIDFVYVAVQRYNRPRLMKTALKQRRRFFESIAAEESDELPEEYNTPAPDPLDDYPIPAENDENEGEQQ